jgi:uncharacterized 2Fe-2S/4Fe-4S cluster protein (DUF4445 family)
VDLGTTTLVAQLLDLKTGHVLDAATALNPQVKFGSDLISRIQSCLDGKQEEMQMLIRQKTGEMIQSILGKTSGGNFKSGFGRQHGHAPHFFGVECAAAFVLSF